MLRRSLKLAQRPTASLLQSAQSSLFTVAPTHVSAPQSRAAVSAPSRGLASRPASATSVGRGGAGEPPKPLQTAEVVPGVRVVTMQSAPRAFKTALEGSVVYAIDDKTYRTVLNRQTTPLATAGASLAALSFYPWEPYAVAMWCGLSTSLLAMFVLATLHVVPAVSTHPCSSTMTRPCLNSLITFCIFFLCLYL